MFRRTLPVILLLTGICWLAAAAIGGADDAADVRSRELRAGGDASKRYFLISPGEGEAAPEDGYRLLLVLPGGAGGEDFHPFVKRIFEHALSDDYLLAQLISIKWTPEQQIVWPTRKSLVPGQRFSTEEFVEAVVKDVKEKYRLDPGHVFTLSWSSGGPAAYALSLQKQKSVTGSFIAMSVFKPQSLPALEAARGHAYFLYHSPTDGVCPFTMAKAANVLLGRNGATVELTTYQGGHGWRGDVYGAIRRGIEWLERATGPAAPAEETGQPAPSESVLLSDGFETGRGAPDGWAPGAPVPGVEYIWDRSTAFEGKASLCLKKTVPRFFPAAGWSRSLMLAGKAGKLRVSARVKAAQAAKAVIDLQFLDAKGNWIGHQWAAYIGPEKPGDPPADHDWKEYAGTVSIPEKAEKMRVGLQIYGPGTVWFDNLTVARVDSEVSADMMEVFARAEKNRALIGDFRSTVVIRVQRFLEGIPDKPAWVNTTELGRLFQGQRYRLERWCDDVVDEALLAQERPELLEEWKKRKPSHTSRYDIQTYDGEASWLWEEEDQKGLIVPGASSSTGKTKDRSEFVMLSDRLKVKRVGAICLHPDASVVGREKKAGDEVILVEAPYTWKNVWLQKDYVKAKVAILPRKGSIIRRAQFFDGAGRLLSVYEAAGVRQHPGGVWLADRAFREHYRYGQDGSRYLHQREEAELENLELNPTVSDDEFRLDFGT
jgi:predicted esterase